MLQNIVPYETIFCVSYPDYVAKRSEELLNLLLWSADMFLRPTFRNLTDSYVKAGLCRNGLLRRIRHPRKAATR